MHTHTELKQLIHLINLPQISARIDHDEINKQNIQCICIQR